MDIEYKDEMKPKRIFTDVSLEGNSIRDAKTNIPKTDRDISNKEYVDDGDTMNTDYATRFDTSMIDVGGSKTGTSLKDRKIKDILDDVFYPRILPTYKEAEISVTNEPIRILVGVPIQLEVLADIAKNDRAALASTKITAGVEYNEEEQSTQSNINETLKDIVATFPVCTVDANHKTKLSLSTIFSGCETKKDSHGDDYIIPPYDTMSIVTHEVKWKPILPLMYNILSSTVEPEISTADPSIMWSDVVEHLKPVTSLDMYEALVNETRLSMTITSDEAKLIQLFVPGKLKTLTINGNSMLDCIETAETLNVLKEGDKAVTYTGVEFYTGDVAFSKNKQLTVSWESTDLFYDELSIITPVKQLQSSGGHIVVDDNNIEYPNMKKIQYTNTTVENFNAEDKTVVKIHPVNSDVDGGYYDE